MQQRKANHPERTECAKKCRADRVQGGGNPRRNQRVRSPHQAELDDSCGDLSRAHERSRGNRGGGGCASRLEQSRQMCRHRAGDEPGGGEEKNKHQH